MFIVLYQPKEIEQLDNGNLIIAIKDVLETFQVFSEIIVNLLLVVTAVVGMSYVLKMRDKQKNTAFSYLSRLHVRLKYYYTALKKYKDEIMERFILEDKRHDVDVSKIDLIDAEISQLAENAQETLAFLKEENDQMPAAADWTEKYNLFVEFLLDFKNLNMSSYYKWEDSEDSEYQLYYEKHLNNIERMINDIEKCQKDIEKTIFHNWKSRYQ